MSCARPLDTASRVANSAYTLTESCVLSTDGSAEPDAFGSAGDRGQHHVTCRVHEIGPVVLADVERVDPDGIGEDALLNGVADDDGAVERLTGLIDAHEGGRIQSELNLLGGH